jgi:hypothetical protein
MKTIMAKDVLKIDDEFLENFIEILEKGIYSQEMDEFGINEKLKKKLQKWIKKRNKYLKDKKDKEYFEDEW